MLLKLAEIIEKAFSPEKALEYSLAIHSIDRFFSFKHMRESAAYVAGRLREIGMEDVVVLEAPADGSTLFEDTCTMLAWDAEDAILDVELPDGTRERVVDYKEIPCGLIMYSGSTEPEGVWTDLVPIDDLGDEELLRRDLAGKLILTSRDPEEAKRLAIKSRALGLVSSHIWNPDLDESVAWSNTFSDRSGVWGFTAEDALVVGLNISPSTGTRLREAARTSGGSLKAFVRVNTRHYAGAFPLVTGVIPGTDKRHEEVILTGHMYEQGATDNAGGCGVRIEAARALLALIRQGALPRPRRSIRLLFVFEGIGSAYYAVANRDRLGDIVAAIEIDGAGDDHLSCRNPIGVKLSPYSTPNYMDGLIVKLLDDYLIAKRGHYFTWWKVPSYHMLGHGSGSDANIVTFAAGAPAMRFGHANYLWHTSADTAEKLSAANLGYLGTIMAACSYMMARAGEEEAIYMANVSATYGMTQMIGAAQGELDAVYAEEGDRTDRAVNGAEDVEFMREWAEACVESIYRLVEEGGSRRLDATVQGLREGVRVAAQAQLARVLDAGGLRETDYATIVSRGLTTCEQELASIFPRRRVVTYPFHFRMVDPSERSGFAGVVISLLHWCDGKRSALDVCRHFAHEVRPKGGPSPDLDGIAQILSGQWDIRTIFEKLRNYGYIDFAERG